VATPLVATRWTRAATLTGRAACEDVRREAAELPAVARAKYARERKAARSQRVHRLHIFSTEREFYLRRENRNVRAPRRNRPTPNIVLDDDIASRDACDRCLCQESRKGGGDLRRFQNGKRRRAQSIRQALRKSDTAVLMLIRSVDGPAVREEVGS
jgi:hypothetical protein